MSTATKLLICWMLQLYLITSRSAAEPGWRGRRACAASFLPRQAGSQRSRPASRLRAASSSGEARRTSTWRAHDHHANGIEPRWRQGPAGIPAVLARDLAHQGQAEPRTCRTSRIRRAIEGRKNALAVFGRDPRAMVSYEQRRRAISTAHVHGDRRSPVLLRVVEQITHHSLQQPPVAPYDHGFAQHGAILIAGGLLGGDSEQIDILAPVHASYGTEATGEQDLLD